MLKSSGLYFIAAPRRMLFKSQDSLPKKQLGPYRSLIIGLLSALIAGCVSPQIPPDDCPPGTQALTNCPPLQAIDHPATNDWYNARTWKPAGEWARDPIEIGREARIPIQDARVKLLGTRSEDALYSLAAKIYMVEQAEHSVDAVYYIFKDDLVGKAFLGALCNAVQRGVDVRLLVDSLGSISIDKNWFRALYQCQLNAGFIRNRDGELTTNRARVQVVIFNAISKVFVNINRRSHDKLMVVDGFVADKAIIVTGGRNMSLSYYGINADGSPNPDTYLDGELLLRPGESEVGTPTLGHVSELYFGLLNGYKNNKQISGRVGPDRQSVYPQREQSLKNALTKLKSLPLMAESLAAMPEFMNTGFRRGEVRLAHEFANLTNKRVVSEAVENLKNNPNSIMGLFARVESTQQKHVRIVSPYLFAARYYGPDGEVLLDEAEEVRAWLAADPERTYEVITNSVLTSDNFSAQSVVDTDMAPRLLLNDEQRKLWEAGNETAESNTRLLESIDWQAMLNNPRLKVYETGRLDDSSLGGDVDYGKLHAKYFLSDRMGFLGTANFDYRSRLFNNEMGFFFISEALSRDLLEDFEYLKTRSYLWGSPEWLEMRRQLIDQGGIKGWTTDYQGKLFRFLESTGLSWFF